MRKFVLALWGFIALGLCGLMVYNVYFDPYGIFREVSYRRYEPNQHFVKVRYLLANPTKYDAYAFGSSRVGKMDLERIANGRRWYNMTYSEGLPAEWLADVKLMLAHGVTIRELLITVDDFSYRIDPAVHRREYMRMPYDEGELARTYILYLLKKPGLTDRAIVPEGTAGVSKYDIVGTGRVIHDFVDRAIEQDPDAHRTGPKFKEPITIPPDNRSAKTIAELRELKEIADANGIKITFIINPFNHLRYEANNQADMAEFKRELAAVTDYYDFSGLNEITTDNYNYYETSHFRPLVGAMIIDRIYHGAAASPLGFGECVTRENVEEHLARLARQMKN